MTDRYDRSPPSFWRGPPEVENNELTDTLMTAVTVANFFFVSVVLTNLFVTMLTSTYDKLSQARPVAPAPWPPVRLLSSWHRRDRRAARGGDRVEGGSPKPRKEEGQGGGRGAGDGSGLP